MECERCGVAICDLPYEDLGMDLETAEEILFVPIGNRVYCMGCVEVANIGGGDD